MVTPQGPGRPHYAIVFPGMGKPMDNLDNVLGAIDVLRDHHGPSIPISESTISTVGRIDSISKEIGRNRFWDGWHQLNLAIAQRGG